jgi:DNA-binding response OmpR family regulator
MTDAPVRLLIAEDDRALADVIRFRFVKENMDVVVAHDGQAALQTAQTQKFDVVICDYQMPHLNGEQVLTGIRAGGCSQGAILILCTAKGYELNADQLKSELQLTEILLKPFSIVKMLSLVKESLSATCLADCAVS